MSLLSHTLRRGLPGLVKKIPQAQNLKRSKKAKEIDVSLEAHASTVSPDDVSSIS
jgi:hypothetical protein